MNKPKKHPLRFIVWIIVLLVIIHFLIKLISFTVASLSLTYQRMITPRYDNTELKKAVNDTLKNSKGRYSFAIYNVKTKQEYILNENHIYNTASLYKLWIMAIVEKQLQDKKIQKDELLTKDTAILNDLFDIPEESAEQTSGVVSFTVEDSLEKMITLSDNTTSLLLTDKITREAVRNFLNQYKLNESIGGEKGKLPTSTASDMMLFFKYLYNGMLADNIHTQQMIDLLKRQELNDIIPKYLPKTISIAHKTGEIDSFAHDAGIIYAPFGNYIFVGLSESGSPPDAEDRIAKVSESVFKYFKKDDEIKIKEAEKIKKELNMTIKVIIVITIIIIIIVIFLYKKNKKSNIAV